MLPVIKQVSYFHVLVPDDWKEAARILAKVDWNGLLGFVSFPRGAGSVQLDFIPEDPDAFADLAESAGLRLSPPRPAFLVREDRETVFPWVVNQLALHGIAVTSMQIFGESGTRQGVFWVKPRDVQRVNQILALRPSENIADLIDEASTDSFPASDAPPWNP